MDLIVPLSTFLVLGLVVIRLISGWLAGETDRGWLTRTLVRAFLLRMAVATLFSAFPALRIFHEDAVGYEYNGLAFASAWRGLGPPLRLPDSNWGFYALAGAIDVVFGRYAVNISYFNALLGTVTAGLVYSLARKLFHFLVARRATLLICFLPSMILWSSIALKDVTITFATVLALSSCVTLKRELSLRAFLGTILPLAIIQPIRFYMVYFVAFAIIVSFVFDRGARVLTGLYKQLFIGFAAITLFVILGLAGRTQEESQYFNLEQVDRYRHGMASSANSGYDQNVDISTPGGALAYLPLGAASLLLAPFPWQMTSLRALIAAPETIFWWFLVPSTIRGLAFAMRRRFSLTSPLAVFAISMTAAYSLIHGNIGAAFRQRAQILVFLFLFSALGTYLKKVRMMNLDEDLLLQGTIEPPSRSLPVMAPAASHDAR